MRERPTQLLVRLAYLLLVVGTQSAWAETWYVNGQTGDDSHPGTADKPLQSLVKAVGLIKAHTGPGTTIVKIAPGVYDLNQTVVLENARAYTQGNRFILEATILPEDPNWRPDQMPVVASRQIPKISGGSISRTETYSLKVKLNHVTIRGLKFLGNVTPNNWHNCIERVGEHLDDLLVSQCVFEGDPQGADIYCATLATGDRFVVDHCVFKNCGACVVFWDGLEGIAGQGCAMRYCIVDKAYLSGVWTCQTAEDFEFHHNVVINSDYVWLRKPGDSQTYRINECVLVNNSHDSGYGVASGAIGPTDKTVRFENEQVIREGVVVFDTNRMSRHYGHCVSDSLGYELKAGLFKP